MRRLSALLLIVAAVFAGRSYSQSGGSNLIVSLKNGQGIGHLNKDLGLATVRQVPGQLIYLVHSSGNADDTLKKLQKDPSVDGSESDQNIRLSSVAVDQTSAGVNTDSIAQLDRQTMTDFYGAQVLRAYVDQQALSIIHAGEAHAISTGAGTRVAYIDTGIDPSHPALQPWIAPGVDLVANRSESELDSIAPLLLRDTDTAYLLDTDNIFLLDRRLQLSLTVGLPVLNGMPDSTPLPPAFGHGTMVAGTIHAVAPEAMLVPIKAFDAFGNTTLFTVIDGINRAVDMGVDVINMSFSTTSDSDSLRKAITRAHSNGIDVVASAGNEGREIGDAFPAAYPLVYGVAASDFQDRLASFSNYGKPVSITAPGAYVISTVPGGGYAVAWGTSFSAPLVSGALAVVASGQQHYHFPGIVVVNTADSIDTVNPGYAHDLGKGRLNVLAAAAKGN